MTDKQTEPLRGEAAWRAQRAEIAKRNDAVRARAEREKVARNEAAVTERLRKERRERESLPEQPHPL